MTTNKLEYKVKKVVMTKTMFESMFAFQPDKRKIRTSQVRVLVNALEEGHTFPGIAVNDGNQNFPDKLVVIDGNHRDEALRKFFDKHPTARVEVLLFIYSLETEEEERELFRVLNNTVTPSSDDLIQQYKSENGFIKKILSDIPKTHVYGTKFSPIKVRPILVAYFDAVKPDWSASMISGMDLVWKADSEAVSNVRIIKEFLRDYQNWFGELSKDNIWMRTTAINVMFRLWYQNKTLMSMDEMQERMRKIINHETVIRGTAKGGRNATEEFADDILKVLNRQRKLGRSSYTNFVLKNNELY